MSYSQESEGYLYILTNDDMPGLVKVGKTYASAEGRAQQLSNSTGVPSSFKVFKAYRVAQCDAAERRAHVVLAKVVGRPNDRREFFAGTPETICQILDEALAAFRMEGEALSCELAQCLLKVERGQFRLAHAEFELCLSSMSLSRIEIMMAPMVKRMLGAYLAACCFVDRKPLNVHHLLDTRWKSELMAYAINFLEPSGAGDATRVISFVRSLE